MKKKEIKYLDPESNNNRDNKLINKSFSHDTNNSIIYKTRPKNYELYNIVSETRDSVYSPEYEEFSTLLDDDLGEGQVYVSEDKIRDIVKEELDKRLGILQENE